MLWRAGLVAILSWMLPASAHSETFIVKIDVTVTGGSRPIVKGVTNLPDGMRLAVSFRRPWLPDGQYRISLGLPACGETCWPISNDHVVEVKNGRFEDGPFNDAGRDLKPGRYMLDIETIDAILQPPEARAVIGQKGENMRGPLLGGCCFGHPDPANIRETLEAKARSTRTLGAYVYFGAYYDVRENATLVVAAPAIPIAPPPSPAQTSEPLPRDASGSQTTSAQTSSYYYVFNTQPPDNFLALRTHPSVQYGSRIKKMPNGTLLQFLSGKSDGWWFVKVVPSGEQGWVLSAHSGKRWIECCTIYDSEKAVPISEDELRAIIAPHPNMLAQVGAELQTMKSCTAREFWIKRVNAAGFIEINLNCRDGQFESSAIMTYLRDIGGTMFLANKVFAQ